MENIAYATEADVFEIKDMMDKALATAEPGWYVADDMDFIRRHIKKEGYTLKYVIEGKTAAFLIVRRPGLSQDNLGYCFGTISEEKLNNIRHMESVVVAEDYQGRGLHRKLLQKAEFIEKAQKTECLMATVHPDNIFSLRNFAQEGYECLLETEKYGGLKRKVLFKSIKTGGTENDLY